MEDTNITYLINIETDYIWELPGSGHICQAKKFWVKIDTKGNVNIKSRSSDSYGKYPESFIHDVLVINDNIPIPQNIIDMLQIFIITTGVGGSCGSSIHCFTCIITAIKTLKTNLQTQTIKDKLNNKIMLTYLTKTVNKLIKTNKKLQELQTSYNKLFKKYENLNNYKLKID